MEINDYYLKSRAYIEENHKYELKGSERPMKEQI